MKRYKRILSVLMAAALMLGLCAPVSAAGICKDAPVHDAASHSADAARMFAEALSHGLVAPMHYARKRARM